MVLPLNFCKKGHDLSITRKVQSSGKKYCSQCNNLRNRPYKLKLKYGITEEQFLEILKSQNNVCDLCGSDEYRGKNWCVDHNHETGKVRGILCSPCNLGLGQFKDNIKLLELGIKYLERHNDRKSI